MKLNLDPEWVKRAAEQEDGKCVTALSPELYAEMMASRERFEFEETARLDAMRSAAELWPDSERKNGRVVK